MTDKNEMPDEPVEGGDITKVAKKPTDTGKQEDPAIQERINRMTEDKQPEEEGPPGKPAEEERLRPGAEGPKGFNVEPIPECGQNPWFIMSVVRTGHIQVRCRGMIVPGAGVLVLVETTNLMNGDVISTSSYMEGYRLASDGKGGAFLESINNIRQPGAPRIDPDQATTTLRQHPPGHVGDNGEESDGVAREVPVRQENHTRQRPAEEAGGLGALMSG